MCGIFGLISAVAVDNRKVQRLANHARQRGRDSSGLIFFENTKYVVKRADHDIKNLIAKKNCTNSQLVMGHSRLITNGLSDNQPVVRDGLCLIHNGIIVNDEEIWRDIDVERKFEIDSEAIIA